MRFNAYLVRIRGWFEGFRFADCILGRTEAGGRSWAWALIVWRPMYNPYVFNYTLSESHVTCECRSER